MTCEPSHHYQRLVQRAQRDGRIPALAVALHRADRPLWTYEVGAEPDTQFRIGSVTKTFTAILLMRCRDEGLLDLDDPVGRHIDLPAHGELPIRRLLSHTAGLQREPFGDMWDSMRAPDAGTLLSDLAQAERVLPQARRYHYSNLGMAILGYLVGKLRGGTWEEVLVDQLLTPLGLSGVTVRPTGKATTGYLVDAYSDHARPEPSTDFGAVGPAAQLWGTASDLARWAAFLADPAALDPDARVLAPATLDEMRWPLTVTDEALWGTGFGLGLILVPQGERIIHVGHDGAMPGFLAGVYGRRGKDSPPAFGAAVLGSSGTATEILSLPHTLLAEAAKRDPAEIPPWRPGEPAPESYRSVLGRWWSEGYEYVFTWRDGALRARRADDPAGKPPAIFEELEPDRLRTVSGREAGELLRLSRDPASGAVVLMHWATYRFTRDQQTFGS
ncbi:serine hydrolase domain-containing protein [Rugosimonospora africana]|uniref:Serine hydrolase n=1 Tax=Rugosimonospora africana TaxID=556532 RepID=A0A8J3R4Q3_9ACTN|nr:serine hydrolase domain-containing protein [Rugosimonospora africana]GIH20001.1 serine hydrolase [Rugosimonospora africana]